MNAIYKFVMSMLAKRGGKTGLTTIQSGKGLNVELSVKQIEQTLKNMGVDVSKITSPKEVQKFLNIQDSWLKQQTKQKAKKSKDILKVPKKKEEPFTGFKPKVVKKVDLSKYDDDALNALVDEDTKLLAEANKLSEAGENYSRVKAIEVRRKEIKEILCLRLLMHLKHHHHI